MAMTTTNDNDLGNYCTDQSATHCEYITVATTTTNDNDLEELL